MLPLAGSWTIDSFSRHLDEVDLFPAGAPGFEVYRNYRRWGLESAALDLALRQAGRSLDEALGRAPRPVTFVVSLRLGEPPSTAPVDRRLDRYPGTRFKLGLGARLGRRAARAPGRHRVVASIDFGAYKGTPVDVPTDAGLYQRVAQAFPEAWLEDPDPGPPDAAAVLAPYRDRITWDAPIHSVGDVEALPFAPRTLNCKPSRFGPLRADELLPAHCEARGSRSTGAGSPSSASGAGRSSAWPRCFIRHANDIAPPGWNWPVPGDRPGPQSARSGVRRHRRPPPGLDFIHAPEAAPGSHRLQVRARRDRAASDALRRRARGQTRQKAAAQALLGARAAERMDAKRSREHFRAAIAGPAAGSLKLRQMAEASLALAERRAGDLKVAAEKLGQTPPTTRQLLMLRRARPDRPAARSPWYLRARGVLLLILAVVVLLALGFGIVKLIALPFGGIGAVAWFWGFLLVAAALGVLAFVGRRRQKRARERAATPKR